MISEKRINILLTTVGRRSYMVEYFKEALHGAGEVHAANGSPLSSALDVADRSVITPLIYDSEYIPFLLKYCKDNDITAVISLFDVDLPVLSKHKAEFAQIGTTVIVADPWITEICNDKWKTYQFLEGNGFLTPKTYLSLETAISDIAMGSLAYPLFVKPRWGMGSIAVYEADNETELRVFFEKTRRMIEQTYLKYESKDHMNESVIIQEKIKGVEHGMDIINDLWGNPCNVIVKKKIAMRAGETDCSITVDEPEIKTIGERLAKIFRHPGNVDVDLFNTPDGPYVLEMNARFGGGYPFSHMAGVNLPQAIVNWLRNEEVNPEILIGTVGIVAQKDIQLKKFNGEVLK